LAFFLADVAGRLCPAKMEKNQGSPGRSLPALFMVFPEISDFDLGDCGPVAENTGEFSH
jgi:hypothetical protein